MGLVVNPRQSAFRLELPWEFLPLFNRDYPHLRALFGHGNNGVLFQIEKDVFAVVARLC